MDTCRCVILIRFSCLVTRPVCNSPVEQILRSLFLKLLAMQYRIQADWQKKDYSCYAVNFYCVATGTTTNNSQSLQDATMLPDCSPPGYPSNHLLITVSERHANNEVCIGGRFCPQNWLPQLQGSKKITSDRSSMAKVLPKLPIS